MKRLIGISILALLTQGAMASNLLTNGDLELPGGPPGPSSTATGWTFTFTDIPQIAPDPGGATLMREPWADHTTNGGGGRGLWFRSFLGNAFFIPNPPPNVDAELTQDVAGTPGATYTLSAWYRAETYYSGANLAADTQSLLALDFLGAGDALIGSAELDLDEVNTADGQWRQFSVAGVAPAGTVEVRARASFIDGVLTVDASGAPLNPQSAFIDDFVLTPEPASLLCMLPALAMLARRR